jgi:hypothetical protein
MGEYESTGYRVSHVIMAASAVANLVSATARGRPLQSDKLQHHPLVVE